MLLRTIRVSAFILLIATKVPAQTGSGADSFLSGWLVPVILILILSAGAFVFLQKRAAGGSKESLGLAESESPRASERLADRALRQPSEPAQYVERRKSARPSVDVKASPAAKMPSVDIRDLPISRIESIHRPSLVDQLAESNDDGLLAAIDELQDDADADSEFRLIALRVLAGFRNKNSVDTLAQIALYDLSANMRSKAVAMLADIDHESVFEPIVLACADPSREVRAAGARALFKITFDRADAWARFAHSDDQYIGSQIARAAVESGIAERSFDRLAMRDEKAAYEAFTLIYLLIASGETEKVFEAVKNHRDLNVRLALLHSMKVANVAEVIPRLSAFIAAEPMSSEVADRAREALLGINAVPVAA